MPYTCASATISKVAASTRVSHTNIVTSSKPQIKILSFVNDKNQYLQYNIVSIGLIWHHVIRYTIKNDAKLPIKCMHWYLGYKSETLDTLVGVISRNS